MTTRLYYTDSRLLSFDATVVSSRVEDGRTVVVLDQTAFYPTSGGPPFDVGLLGGSRVVDVVDLESGEIAHIVDGAPLLAGSSVRGEIDAARRLDHMQQHTGQHILSAAFDRLFGVRTTSFHLGDETATIDLAREVGVREIADAEAEANRIVWDDRLVDVRFVSEQEAAALPLRKAPARTGTLRLVDVEDFDLSACGGTHVPRTGVIGIIAIAGWERFKGGSRITFACGKRALTTFGRLRDAVADATRQLSVARHEIPEAIERLQADVKASKRAVVQLQEQLAQHLGAELRASAVQIGSVRAVLREQAGWDQAALKMLASAVVSEPGYVVVMVGDGEPRPVVAARSKDVAFDCGAFIKSATAALGGKGGGRPELAQGGITASTDAILSAATKALG